MFQQFTNASLSWGDARSGFSITFINCSAPPASSMQACSSLESWDIRPSGSVMPVVSVISDSAAGVGGGVVGRGTDGAVGGTSVGVTVGSGISVGGEASTGAVVAN